MERNKVGKKILDNIKVSKLKIIKVPQGNIMKALNKSELKKWERLQVLVAWVGG